MTLFERCVLMKLEECVLHWLSKYFDTEQKQIEEMLKNELATSYLLIWPIMEKDLFNGFMTKTEIKDSATKLEQYYSEIDTEGIAEYFHKRYQNKDYYRNLKHSDNYQFVDDIINKNFEETSLHERMELLIYVVYRYRNNIFHGNKGIESWTRFRAEINLCIRVMMRILDCSKSKL